MRLKNVDTVDHISPEEFKEKYYNTQTPLIIKDLAKSWPAYQKWDWDYFKQVVGDKEVGIYNNIKSDAYTPINKADDYVKFGEYIDMIRSGPAQWRIFLFNIFSHAPELARDFTWPTHLMNGFVKRAPMLFTGGQGAVTHMHFDIDLSHILHTQFMGRKKVLLFPYAQKDLLYRKPFEVLSMADYTHYYDEQRSKIDFDKFPALKYAEGYDLTLEHGDTLFMPAGYWHHMEYLDSGFAMSLRALNNAFSGKLRGVWNIVGMRYIDTMMKRIRPHQWYDWKQKQIQERSEKEILSKVS
ncbi:MAG TPA: cupin-like domain-containing protein [Arachidicoccus sp.]|nr:cupin-like domain-containing protein [Arachidicoccus sp.]